MEGAQNEVIDSCGGSGEPTRNEQKTYLKTIRTRRWRAGGISKEQKADFVNKLKDGSRTDFDASNIKNPDPATQEEAKPPVKKHKSDKESKKEDGASIHRAAQENNDKGEDAEVVEAPSAVPEEPLVYVRKKPLMISVSDISSVCHYNPFANLVELVTNYLYKGIPEILEYDAKRMRLRVVSTEDRLTELIQSTRNARIKSDLSELVIQAKTGDKMGSVKDTKQARDMIANHMEKVKELKTMTPEELLELEKLLQYELCTQFGIRSERKALLQYQKQTGWDVCEVPDFLFLGFKGVEGSVVNTSLTKVVLDPNEPEVPQDLDAITKEGSDERLGSSCSSDQPASELAEEEQENEKEKERERERERSKKEREEMLSADKYDFCLVGRVDGLTDHIRVKPDRQSQPGNDEADEEEWEFEPVVLEVKNRTSEARMGKPPHFHEIIQLLTYMRMLGCRRGELIDSFVVDPTKLASIYVTTVVESEMHDEGWNQEIVPRLVAFNAFIENLRCDEEKRLEFIAADVEKQLEFLLENLPWWT